MEPTTFWVLGPRRNMIPNLAVCAAAPEWIDGDWNNVTCAAFFIVPLHFHQALGLPAEPKPGSCWEVRHETIEWFVETKMEKLHTLAARNVTEELMAKDGAQ